MTTDIAFRRALPLLPALVAITIFVALPILVASTIFTDREWVVFVTGALFAVLCALSAILVRVLDTNAGADGKRSVSHEPA